MRVYKLQATVAAGSNDSIAQLDIVEDGKIERSSGRARLPEWTC